ncbi:lysophospholipid acyltransferase family protein [Actinoplanes derwentensis]|uniref:1-acyl-sn-glycerol-3-phosphate acyltransferase n=1 Tax=Actinoplanes derwentensis TaxID=113562 RepID=A0A1H1ZG74_9ACTN|nr:lysophospholipid acyltransferase family protein [Actinoplanes derwentensis]GID82416.1 1-acyl-sn-glycerol-3-phosphate acyltransferase [Actinoplanes derwentensis]SDT32502.1 1-acyl-sn-glycerol-3-phosphate acyltransferase [Actinoplanes derwentensis]
MYELVKKVARMRVEGAENVPANGPLLLASNHLSVTDSTFLPMALGRKVTFMAKAEYFTGRGPWGRFVSWFMSRDGQVAVDRDDTRAAVRSLDSCLEVLERGDPFGIYPEGTRSPDGRLYRGRTGVAWLALKSKAPVVPVAMFGTDRVLPPGTIVPRPARVRVVFGKPVQLSAIATDPDSARDRRAATDAIVAAIADLSGQDYVPRYAPRVTA